MFRLEAVIWAEPNHQLFSICVRGSDGFFLLELARVGSTPTSGRAIPSGARDG